MQPQIKNLRNSNIELLRIITMFGVIILHYNNEQIGGAFKYASSNHYNLCILYILECIFISAVNIFILISGYYLCSKNNLSISKPCLLIIQVILFRIISYIVFIVIDKEAYSYETIRIKLLPINYFVILYVALYILAPFINFLINKISTKSFSVLVLILLFSVWPTIVDFLIPFLNNNLSGLSTISMYGSQYGYTIVNFVLMYILGAYIYKANIINKIKNRMLFTFTLLVLCWITLLAWTKYNLVTQKSLSVVFSYCNPIVIASAILTFMLFIGIKQKNNRFINILAKGSFSVYLAHTYFFELIAIDKAASKSPFVLVTHIIISCLFIYLVCWIISIIYSYIERVFFSKLLKKLTKIQIICK